jgi:hypothetical protein
MRAGSRRAFAALIVIVIVLALAGAGFIGAYFYLQGRGPRAPAGPLSDWVSATAVQPNLALWALAGWSDQSVIDRCLAEGQPDTALAVAAHSVRLTDRARAGALLRIAGAYASAQRAEWAASLYERAALIAALSPELADLTRAELFIQIGAGLIGLRRAQEARAMLDQAAILVRRSAELKPAQREQAARELTAAYRAAGDAQAQVTLDSAPAAARSREELPAIAGATVVVDLDDARLESLRNVVQARQRQATSLAQALETKPTTQPADLIAGLNDALLAEDLAVLEAGRRPDLPAALKAEVTTAWATTQVWIARRGLGMSLAPAWEPAAAQLEADLAVAWRNLLDIRRQQAMDAAPPAGWLRSEIEVSLARGELLAGLLGLMPGYDIKAGVARLQAAQSGGAGQAPAWIVQAVGEGYQTRCVIAEPPAR